MHGKPQTWTGLGREVLAALLSIAVLLQVLTPAAAAPQPELAGYLGQLCSFHPGDTPQGAPAPEEQKHGPCCTLFCGSQALLPALPPVAALALPPREGLLLRQAPPEGAVRLAARLRAAHGARAPPLSV